MTASNRSYGSGQTITIGFCPGCKTLHRTSDCPDDNPPEEACICCEAIRTPLPDDPRE